MAKKSEYTEERLLQAYNYEMRREKNNKENGNQESTTGTTYTQKNLLDAYYKETGHQISEPAYSTPKKSYAKKTVQADERMTLQKMQENAKQLGDNKDQYGMFSPQEAIMNASLHKHLNADSLSNPLTSKMTANTISDEAMNVAINMLKNKQTETNREFSDKFMSGQMISDELPAQMKQYKDALDLYETEKEARAVAQENERQEMYNTRRDKILEELPEEARKLVDTYTESEAMYNATTISNADAMMRLNYSKAMQDAKTQLSEEYGIEGAELQRVLQYAKELSDKENTEELQSQVQKDIEEHPVLAGAAYTAMDVLASPATGIMAATESLKHQGYADKGAPVNTNSAEYGLMNFSNTTEQAVNKQIDNPVGRFAYNVGTSTAKSALSAAIGGEVVGALGLTGTAASLVGNIVTLPQFGASAYASTLQEDQEKGITTENATKHAVAAGVGEMLFEVASLDKVWAIANRSGKVAAKQVLMDILVEAGIEGSEEGFTDIWNRVADDIINGSQSDYNMSVNAYIKSGYSEEEARAQASKDFYAEVALDVLAGAASGGIMGGGTNIVSAVNYHNLGKYVDGNTELKQSVYDAAMSMDENSMTRQIIQDKSADEMTAADMADVLHAMTEESEMDTEQILEERFVELGESKKEAKADARRVIEAVTTPSEEVTEEANEARSAEFATNENLATVYAETLKGELTKPQDAVRAAQESYSSSKYYDSLIKRGKTDGTGIARATINATGEEMEVVEIHEISNGKAVVRMKDNSLKNLEDIQIEDPVKQSLYNFATSMEDAKVANAVIEEYKGQSLASYAEACAVFYNAGKVGSASFESMMSNPKNSALVSNMSSPATLQLMYFMGENHRSAKKEKVAPVQQKKSEKQSAGKAVRKEGRVIDNRTDKSDSRMADIAKKVAKKTGLEITLNDSLANGENGHFQKSLARIALSEMADNQYTTLVHEINEFAESYNPEGMKQVIDTVLDYAQTEEGAAFLFGKENGIIQRYQNVYRQRVEADKTYEGAAEEFVFDYLSGVFSSKEGVEDFSRYMTEEGMSQKEQKGILETIADFFKELADKITSYLDEHVLSKTAQKGLQADAEKAREIRQMVMDVWENAIENSKAEQLDGLEKVYSLYVDEHILQKAQQFKEEGYKNFERVEVLGVTEKINAEIKRLMDFDATGYKIFSSTSTYKHIEKRHGESGAQDQSMKDMRDVALMTYVLENFENAELVLNKGGKPAVTYAYLDANGNPTKMIKFSKEIDGIQYVVVAAAENKYKKLWVMSEYKEQKKKDTSRPSHGDKALPPTPKTHLDNVSSTDIISRNTENATKKYSINVDSDGRRLSEGQKKYFKDSKVRDEAGKLLVMYHGTPQGGFTVFKPDLHFFSPNKNYADIYQSTSASSRNSRKEASNPYTYEVYLNIKNPFDIREPEVRKVFVNDYVKGGYALGINPYVEYKDTTSTGLPSWEEADNIYEFLEENDLLEEYDGIIVDEGGIPGENGKTLSRGIAYVTFSENQIKRVDNLNPTENKDIRYSIDIDDSLFSALQETYSAQEEEFASIVQDGFAALKKVTVNEKVMHKVAYDIKKEYKSSYDINKLQENLTRVFAYLKDNADTVGYADMVRIVQEIAKPVIEQSTDVDAFEQELYNNFRAYLKGKRIRLSEEQKAEVAYYYGSYENFRKKNLGNITLSDEGTYLDNIWSEICDNSYQMLDIEVSTADEPIALIDALSTLRPTKKNIYGMDTEQAAYDLALDIYRRFFVEQAEEQANRKVNEKAQRLIVRQQEYRKRVKQEYDASLQRLREAEQQKRRNLAEKYEQKIHDLKEDQKAMRYYSDVKASKEIERKVNYYTKKLVETNQKANDRILQIKASNRENMINKRRNEELRQYRERIKKNTQGIVTMFNTNTDKKHVPEVLKEPVANFITSIDFVSERASADSAATIAWQDALNQMHRKLSDREAAVDGGYIELYDALHNWEGEDKKTSALLSDMSAFIEDNSGVKVSEMKIEQLKQLNELVTRLKRAIASVNQLYVNKRTKNVQELGSSTVAELSAKKKKASKSQLGEMAENLLEVDMLDSRSYFYRLGDSAFSIYEGLRNGFSERVWMLKEAQQYMEKELDGLDVKKWTGDKAEVHKIIIQGKELYMTTGQIMSLYELKNRYQAKTHLRNGGIRPSKIGKGRNAIERITPLKLTDYEIDLICKELTPEQKKAADAMQRFMAENCAEWGNKTSMLMYGYKRFEASNYFPIKTDGNSVDTRDDSKYYGTKNQGFTKETTANASNAVIVSDIFDVFTKHVADMASYSAFTAPLMDAMKWFNYRNVSYDGDIAVYGESVKSEIERAYGAQYLEYFKKLIKDINAETSRGFESQISDTLTSRMKAASVGANVRVAIQQPTAYVRAMAVMNPKYLVKALPKKSQIKKAQENSAITQWKSWGYFETSIGMSMKNIITGQDTLKNKVVEKSMTFAQLGDDITWGYLWNACEAEIKDKHPNVKYDSEEFLKLVSERFDDVVDQTQVVDSVLHRSHIMRSDNGIVKMATSFMAEPTKSYNMLMNQIRDVYEGGGKAAKKRLGNAVVAYCVTGLLNAAVVSIVDAARDMDDDDDTYWERYFDALGDNIKDNLNPFGMIPYVKDILSILQGYDVERMDMQGISNVIAGAQKLYKYINDEEYRQKHTLWDVSKTLIQGTSQVLGIPVYNALRDLESAVYTITGVRIGGIKRSSTRNYELMVDAVLDGDEEKQNDIREELKENGIGDEDLKSGLQSYVKKSFMDGELTEEDVVKFYGEFFGADDGYVQEKIVEWKTGGIEDEYKDEIIKEEEAEARLVELGTEVEDAEEEIRGWQVDIIEDNYLNNWITQEEAENELEKVEGLEAEEVYSNLKEWNYEKENPLATYTKNTVLYDAIDYAYSTGNIDDRDAIKEEITELLENGSEKKDITRAITSRYKSQYLELKAAGRCADMKNLLISAYMMAGLSWNEAVEKIDGWEEVEEE